MCLAAGAGGQNAPGTNIVEPVPDPKSTRRGDPTGNVLKASDLIGMTVERGNRQKIGKVEDVVVGLETGRIVAVVVALDENSTLRAVPPGVLHYDLLQKILHLKADPAKLKASAPLERPTWKESLQPGKLAALYRHFDVEPFFDPKEAPSTIGVMEMATKLDGSPVKNRKDEQIGQVQNCMVNLSTGHIPFVIIATGAYIGNEGALSPVPAQALEYDKKREMLVLEADRESLATRPRFKPDSWPDMNKGAFTETVFAAYGLEPEQATSPAAEPEKTAQNAAEDAKRTETAPTEVRKLGSAKIGESKKVTPLDQGNSKDDIGLTAAIRKEIVARKDLAFASKNIQIITKDAKVTLRGEVQSKDEKNIINDIAVKQAGKDAVDNQLDVK